MSWPLICFFSWHYTAYRGFARSLISTDFQARLDNVKFIRRDHVPLRMTALDVRSTLICGGDSLPTCVAISFSSCGQLWRVSVFFYAFFVLDSCVWMRRSACRQRVTLLLLLSLLSPCMYAISGYASWNHCTSKLCLHFNLLWRRRWMLWIDFRADNKLNGNTENECFCSTHCVTLSVIMTPWPSQSVHMWSRFTYVSFFEPSRPWQKWRIHEHTHDQLSKTSCSQFFSWPCIYLQLLSWNYCTCKLRSSLHFRRSMLPIFSGDCFAVERVSIWWIARAIFCLHQTNITH